MEHQSSLVTLGRKFLESSALMKQEMRNGERRKEREHLVKKERVMGTFERKDGAFRY